MCLTIVSSHHYRAELQVSQLDPVLFDYLDGWTVVVRYLTRLDFMTGQTTRQKVLRLRLYNISYSANES